MSRRQFGAFVGGITGTAALGATLAPVAWAQGASTFSGTLDANSGGSFAYYSIADPSGTALTFTAAFSPFSAGEAHQMGVVIWQNGSSLAKATATCTGLKDKTTSNAASVSATPAAGQPVLIQVFNYTNTELSYTLAVSGDTVVPVKPSAPAPPSPQTVSTNQVTGSLTGTSGGAFAQYVIASPAASSTTYTLSYAPYTPGTAHQIGLQVWQNGAELAKGAGTATGFKDKTTSSTVALTVTPVAGSPVTLAVFNYSNTTISYTLST
ncbi:MAG: hypothetical protein M1118_10080 [Chloroflexi bacterium]|nr:hypothetical protein [Chloroflexota bacterium]